MKSQIVLTRALIAAIEQHDLNSVAEALTAGADPNAPDPETPDWSPLKTAVDALAEGGSMELLTLLLAHGADVNGWDASHDTTPLLLACFRDDSAAVAALLRAGAEPNVTSSEGDTPLRWWVAKKDYETVRQLLEAGAHKTINQFGGLEGLTPLGIAASNFDIPMIELLLRAGAKPEAVDDYNKTARDHLPPRESRDPDAWDRVMELLGRRQPR